MTFQKKRTTEVVDGMRGRDANPELLPEGPQNVLPSYMRAPSSDKQRQKPVYFQSRYIRHIVSLIPDIPGPVDPATGRSSSTKPIMAQFKDGLYALDLDPRQSAASLARNKMLYEILIQHPRCGVGKDFWLADEAKRLSEEAQYQQMKATVKADPALVNRLLQDLKGEEFPLPPAEEVQAEAAK